MSFHTSHVTVQHGNPSEQIEVSFCFHTSHVTVQRLMMIYISHICGCFHTSHVTVQLRFGILLEKRLVSFHTSHVTVQHGTLWITESGSIEFPYIPCYCSTQALHVIRYNICCFHTSHVTVQLINSIIIKMNVVGFHTSHVTVQQRLCMYYIIGKEVSIHPMLLFNMNDMFAIQSAVKFPYIPCYCSTSIKVMRILLIS